MQQPSKIAPSYERHEDIFLARYARLRIWALQLTSNDRERAEDLAHDAFIQFTFTRPDLNQIHNLDGYLYSMLRNLHLSQVRRTLRLQSKLLSIVDYDSAEIGLRQAIDPREQMRLQDELRQVCQYACMRKETSKAGSVLILRFMHGYYPREIAQVMRSTRQAVEERLRIARTEARRYLEEPTSLRFMREEPPRAAPPQSSFAQTTDELLCGLRRMIFQSCRGNCLASDHLEKLYREDAASAMDCARLGHVVSCPRCLDAVNKLLGLPLLSERYPTDMTGTDTRPKGGGGGDDNGGGRSTGMESEKEFERRARRRAKDVFEHRPQELCISVNGYLMAAQKISSRLSEQTLTINVTEKIDFVEVISEQEIRLLFMGGDELLMDDSDERSARVKLSDDRTLEATLSFSNSWATMQVVYHDPLMNPESAAQPDGARERNALFEAAPATTSHEEQQHQETIRHGRRARVLSALTRLLRHHIRPDFWLRPGTVTVVLSLILIAALLFVRMHVPTVSAAELLRRSTVAEEMFTGNPDVVLHRTIALEERRGSAGDLIARQRIEVWQSAARGIKLRRIYDEQNRLVAGEWTKTDGTSTIYRRGTEPQIRTAPEVAGRALLETGELWRLDASAKDFSTLIGHAEGVKVEERPATYVFNYQSESVAGATRLRRATLTLDRDDLRAIEQTLLVEREGETHEYRFVESSFKRQPANTVSPTVFQPEPELLGPSGRTKDKTERAKASDAEVHTSALNPQPTEAAASAELEVEVAYLLNQIKANLGEQVNMTRSAGGVLRVEALVETERRKGEILRALGPVINNPAIKIDISTIAEALKRQPQAAQSKPRDLTVREVEVTSARIPADAELRRHFSARLAESEAIDEEIKRYANRVINRSRQALLRASALKRLVGRFSPEETRTLAPQARAKWLAMIREHAQGYQREMSALRQDLRPIFPDAASSGGAADETVSEANLTQAAARLLQLSYAHDEAVRSAFTVSADGRTTASVKSSQFWRSLKAAEKLAASIEGVYQK